MKKTSEKVSTDRVLVVYFAVSLSVVSIGYGMYAWKMQWFPANLVTEAIEGYKSVRNPDTGIRGSGDEAVKKDRPPHASPARYRTSGAQIHYPDKVSKGSTLISALWDGVDSKPGLRLIDIEGNILHHWEVNIPKIFPVTGVLLPSYVHGSYVFPNGDVLFNVEYLGLVRMNSCGDVLWSTDYQTHHSVHQDSDGNFWVAGYKFVQSGDARAKDFPGFSTPFSDETLLKFSPEGELLTEISVTEALYNSNYRHLFWHYQRARRDRGTSLNRIDVLHLNDVEPLSPDLAQNFPMFEAGDLLVSLKFISTVAVLSQEGKIKWLSAGDFTEQHDPDFEKDGWITVFDNRMDGSTDGVHLGGSRIRAINPSTGELKDIYPVDRDDIFYTEAGGKHQLLENGNRLLTEARAGRLLEVTPDGRLVWEWGNDIILEKWVSEVLEGTRYPYEKHDTDAWSCKPQQ